MYCIKITWNDHISTKNNKVGVMQPTSYTKLYTDINEYIKCMYMILINLYLLRNQKIFALCKNIYKTKFFIYKL